MEVLSPGMKLIGSDMNSSRLGASTFPDVDSFCDEMCFSSSIFSLSEHYSGQGELGVDELLDN